MSRLASVQMDPGLAALSCQQLGLLTRAQLLAAGVTQDAIRWHLSRDWRALLPGVYQLDRQQPTRMQREVAGLLAAGPRSVLGGLTAARRLGIEAAEPGDTVHVLVPPPHNTRAVGWLSVARTRIPDPVARSSGPMRVSSPPRAVLDAAVQSRNPERAAAIGIEAVQRRLVTIDALLHELERRNRRGSGLARHAVMAASSGAWSVPEAILIEALGRSARLPQVWANPQVRMGDRLLTSPDVWLDDVAMAVMVHSRRYHSQGSDWDRTVEQDGDLTAVGIIVVGVTPNRIFRDLAAVVARVVRTYEMARLRPRPHVTASRRSLVNSRPGQTPG